MELNDTQRLDWLRLSRSTNVGPITFRKLINRFGSASGAIDFLSSVDNSSSNKRSIRLFPLKQAQEELKQISKYGARVVIKGESSYPKYLSSVDSAPMVLCVKGDDSVLQQPTVAIVGSRNASAVGNKIAYTMAKKLGESGVSVVSGMARGIDTSCHKGSLDTGSIAVVAGGIDVVYPPENQDLYKDLCHKGLVVAESPFSTVPRGRLFPNRNRIISGLSLAVVVVEANIRSGSLITVRHALEQGREIFAVPGSPMDSRSSGGNSIIRDGATLVRNADDVLEGIQMLIENNSYHNNVVQDKFELRESDGDSNHSMDDNVKINSCIEKITSLLSVTPVTVDEIIQQSGFCASDVIISLMEMELDGAVTYHSGSMVSI